MKKIVALLLLAVMLFMCACTAKTPATTDEPGKTPTVTKAPDPGSTDPVETTVAPITTAHANIPAGTDFEDADFVIYCTGNLEWHDFKAIEDDKTVIGEATYRRNQIVEEKLGVKIIESADYLWGDSYGSGTGYNAGVKAAQKIFSSLDDISRLVPESPTVVTACFISDLNGAAVTGDELGSVMMSYMGLTNVFKGRQGGTFAYEDLLLSDPTMIFCTEEVQTQLLSDAKYAELTAIATGRVYAIDPKYMEWQGKTVYTAALEMMGLAYPELTETSEASVTMPTATPKPTPEPTPEPTEEPSPSPEATPIPEYDPIPSGDQGEHVFYMQQRLAELGYLTAEYDGFYGEATKESVKAFQTANGLEATGEVDAITHAMIYYEKAVRADGTTAAPAPTPSAEPDETA